ncbi:MAG TPA: tripartite tricarboxylate transporter substrate binding protein [Burkholderiales bacterium]|nr:tripartite tricarboxylate transporter substrate binding protein [Burkholderiales bacterium]
MGRFLLLVLLFAGQVAAQAVSNYPERPIRLVVPYAAGGAADAVARVIGQRMSQELGQPVVIDNRAGADGNIGAEAVARSAPDGYTILMGDVGNMTMGPAVRKSTPYDAIRDFAPISQLVSAPNILAVHPSVPVTNFRELIAYAKANPAKLSFASSGTGGSAHLAGELLKRATGIDIVHIPYKGAAPAIADVLRGDVQLMFGLSVVLPHVRDGKLRAVATTGSRRMASLPDVPTVAELGFPGFEATAWYGLLAPAGTPKAIIARLHDVAVHALQAPEVRQKLEAAGNEIVGSTPEQFASYIGSEKAKWSETVAAAGIKVD